MADSDPRCLPLIEVALDRVQALLYPVLKGATIACVERLEGGLVNTLYRVTPSDGSDSLCLRIFAAGRPSWEKECKTLARVSASLPVPDVLLAGDCNSDFPHPYLVYRWIEGIMLDDCRRQKPSAALLSLAEPLGRLLANVASLSFEDAGDSESNAVRVRPPPIEALLAVNEEMLLRGLARRRIGAALADALWRRLELNAVRLGALGREARLVHGDIGGRNILVAPAEDGNWRVSGLIDWEEAFSGSSLWDVGRLFRYPKRYSEEFRLSFERSYRDAGGSLPEDWRRTARLLDSTRLVSIFNEERELPVVFAECRELIEAIIMEGV